jgi:hypothetical protein
MRSNQGKIHIARVKGSAASVHPLTGRELRALRRLNREQDPSVAVRVHIRTRRPVRDRWLPYIDCALTVRYDFFFAPGGQERPC